MTKIIEQFKMKKLAKIIAGVTLGAAALGTMSMTPVYAASGTITGGTLDTKVYIGNTPNYAVVIDGSSTGTPLATSMQIYGIKDIGGTITGSVTAANFYSSDVKGLQIWGGYSTVDGVTGLNNKVIWESSATVGSIDQITGFEASAKEVSATGTVVTVNGVTLPIGGKVYGANVNSYSGKAMASDTTLTLNNITTKGNNNVYGAQVKSQTSATATGTTVNMTDGGVDGDFYGVDVEVTDGAGVAEANGTTLTINGATLEYKSRGAYVKGKKSGKAINTKVTMTGGELHNSFNAAEVQANEAGSIGQANNTTLIIDNTRLTISADSDGITGAHVTANAGGEILSATGTTVKLLNLTSTDNVGKELIGVQISGDTGFGEQLASATADTTEVEMNGGKVKDVVGAKFYHTKLAEAKVTTVTLNDTEVVGTVIGVNVTEGGDAATPIAETATANDTTVTVTGTKVSGAIKGVNVAAVSPGNDEAQTVTANNTKLTLNDTTVEGDVTGVLANATNSITAKNTQVIFEGKPSTVNGTVYGVNLNGATSITSSGTALTIKNIGNKAVNIANFDTINFYIPIPDAINSTDAMLKLTDDEKTDLSNTTITPDRAVDATNANLNDGDKIYLINKEGNRDLILKDGIVGKEVLFVEDAVTTKKGTYTLDGNDLWLKISEGGEKPQDVVDNEKSLTETIASSVALLNSGADFATEQALDQAKAAAREGVKEGTREMMPFAAFGGSSMRYKSGSHIDAKGWNAALGFAKEQGELTYGIAVDHGQADFDSYVNAAHGEGKNKYTGGVIFAELKKKSGVHFDASFRAGRAENDYNANLSVWGISTPTSYDISATYLGFSLGGGKEMNVSETGTIDLYGRYYFNHLNGANAKTNSGIDIDFKDSDSSRLRLGTRYTQKIDEYYKLYAGLAWQYEFAGKAKAVINGTDAPSPSLKGHSAMLELGTKTKAGKNLDIDLGLNGWVGKQRGIGGNIGLKWIF